MDIITAAHSKADDDDNFPFLRTYFLGHTHYTHIQLAALRIGVCVELSIEIHLVYDYSSFEKETGSFRLFESKETERHRLEQPMRAFGISPRLSRVGKSYVKVWARLHVVHGQPQHESGCCVCVVVKAGRIGSALYPKSILLSLLSFLIRKPAILHSCIE